MAGRGRRLGNIAELAKKVGTGEPITAPFPDDSPIDLVALVDKINEINVLDYNARHLKTIHDIFEKLTETNFVEITNYLLKEAYSNTTFGEKFAIVIGGKYTRQGDVKKELLISLQRDYEKNLNSQNKQQYHNIVHFLSYVYKYLHFGNRQADVLAIPLISSLEHFLDSQGEEELQLLNKIILMHNESFSKRCSLSYDKFKCQLRNKIVASSTKESSKYWMLLAVEYISNNSMHLDSASQQFYKEKLGDAYFVVESNAKDLSKEDLKNENSKNSVEKNKNTEIETIDHELSGINLKTIDTGKKKTLTQNKYQNKASRADDPNWRNKTSPKNNKESFQYGGHDDRFNKNENYYGVQPPRKPKDKLFEASDSLE